MKGDRKSKKAKYNKATINQITQLMEDKKFSEALDIILELEKLPEINKEAMTIFKKSCIKGIALMLSKRALELHKREHYVDSDEYVRRTITYVRKNLELFGPTIESVGKFIEEMRESAEKGITIAVFRRKFRKRAEELFKDDQACKFVQIIVDAILLPLLNKPENM